jgi:hypothetical protein
MTQITETGRINKRTVEDLEPLAYELDAYHEICDDCFSRGTETRCPRLPDRIEATLTEYFARQFHTEKKLRPELPGYLSCPNVIIGHPLVACRQAYGFPPKACGND